MANTIPMTSKPILTHSKETPTQTRAIHMSANPNKAVDHTLNLRRVATIHKMRSKVVGDMVSINTGAFKGPQTDLSQKWQT
jgi:hypothetical protein